MTAPADAPAAAQPSPPAAPMPPRTFRLVPGQDLPAFELTPAAVAEVAPRQAATLVRRKSEGREGADAAFFFFN